MGTSVWPILSHPEDGDKNQHSKKKKNVTQAGLCIYRS